MKDTVGRRNSRQFEGTKEKMGKYEFLYEDGDGVDTN
jgi:hypothetical protein